MTSTRRLTLDRLTEAFSSRVNRYQGVGDTNVQVRNALILGNSYVQLFRC
jgi:hypothetical protein